MNAMFVSKDGIQICQYFRYTICPKFPDCEIPLCGGPNMRILSVCHPGKEAIFWIYWNNQKYWRSSAVKSGIVKVLLIILSAKTCYWKQQDKKYSVVNKMHYQHGFWQPNKLVLCWCFYENSSIRILVHILLKK